MHWSPVLQQARRSCGGGAGAGATAGGGCRTHPAAPRLLVRAAAAKKPPADPLGPQEERQQARTQQQQQGAAAPQLPPTQQQQLDAASAASASPPQLPARALGTGNIVPSPRLRRRQDGAPAAWPVAAVQAADEAGASARGAAAAAAAAAAQATRIPELEGLHRPLGLILGSAWLLAAGVDLAGTALASAWLPVLAGGAIGGLHAAAHYHLGERRLWRAPAGPLRVLITGGSCGIGKALAREFLRAGDRVVITSRSAAGAAKAVAELREEVGPGAWVEGVACDVSDAASIDAALDAAAAVLGGSIQAFVNNAGYSGSFQDLTAQSPEQVARVVSTNLIGSLLCSRAALRHMGAQPGGGHIFNTEGAGSDGAPTPQYSAYGATKAGIAQLRRSLLREAAALPHPVGVHSLSPGMVLTDLLLEGATPRNKQVFNILCEHPETVAAFLVPRARSLVARACRSGAVRYLTPTRALAKLLAAPLARQRYFDAEGRPTYPPERQRLLGERSRRTARLQRRAARRGAAFQLAYAASMAASFFVLVSDALANGGGGH